MKTRPILPLALLIVPLGLSVSLLAQEAVTTDPPPLAGKTLRYNPIHPLFAPLDEEGRPVAESGKPMSEATTCRTCHDVEFIDAHNLHAREGLHIGCLACHTPDGRLPDRAPGLDEKGMVRREEMTLSSPEPDRCGRCHGVVRTGDSPLTLPDTLMKSASESPLHPQHLSRTTGVILSGQSKNRSFLNLEEKAAQNTPWDIHAQRMISCQSCHSSPNNPDFKRLRDKAPRHLIKDPRHLSTADYLKRPDHLLETASCRDCHDPMKTHDFLPYPARHFSSLRCETCHIPEVHAPLLESVDWTVVQEDGQPRTTWRNVNTADESTSPDARYLRAFVPYLFPIPSPDGALRIGPVNLVTERRWVGEADGNAVPFETLRAALGFGQSDWSETRARFDRDHNGRIEPEEWIIRNEADVKWLAGRLASYGVKNPVIQSETRVIPITHGIQARESALRICSACHEANSRFSVDPILESNSPAGPLPRLATRKGETYPFPEGKMELSHGVLRLSREESDSPYFLPGHHREPISRTLGFLFFLGSALGVFLHGLIRAIQSRRNRTPATPHAPLRRVYMYSLYERLWHWLMAGSILLLMLTGLEIHYVSSWDFFGFSNAVSIHNLLALILLLNAFLSFFYHIATTQIRQFIPRRENLVEDLIAQIRFYLHGIFVGAPHPTQKSLERKLNPLQQLTYFALLNVLIPFQVLTGVAIWLSGINPDLVRTYSSLTVLTPLHNLGSWLLLSFLVVHLYLTTTGHTVFSNIRAMIDGHDLIEEDRNDPASVPPAPASTEVRS